MRAVHLILIAVVLLLVSPVASQDESGIPELVPISAENAVSVEQIGMIGFGLIEDIAWSPDGKTVAVAGSLGVTFYEDRAFESRPYQRWALPEQSVYAITYNSDGSMLATVSGERLSRPHVFRLWDATDKSLIAEWEWQIERWGVFTVAFSPDDRQLAVVDYAYDYQRGGSGFAPSWDIGDPSNVRLLGDRSWSQIQEDWFASDESIMPDLSEKRLAAYSPDRRHAAYLDDAIHLVDLNSGTIRQSFQTDMGSDGLFFTPNGQLLVSVASLEAGIGQIRVWDVQSGTELLNFDSGSIHAIAFHPTENRLLYSKWDDALMHWQAGIAEPVAVLGHSDLINVYYDAAFSPDGNTLAAAHGRALEFWDVQTLTKSDELLVDLDNHYISRLVYSPDGALIAAGDTADRVQLFETDTLKLVATVPGSRDFAFHPDGNLFATYGSVNDDISPTAVLIWDLETLKRQKNVEIGQELARIYHVNIQGLVWHIAFSPDGKVVSFTGSGVEMWDLAGVLEHKIVGRYEDMNHDAMIEFSEGIVFAGGSFAYSSDGRLLATGSNGDACSLMIWELATQTMTSCLDDNSSMVNPTRSMVFSSDSSLLITGGEIPFVPEALRRSVQLWNIETWEVIELTGHFEEFNRLALNPDGTLIASAGGGFTCAECSSFDGTIRLWGVPAKDE